MSFIYPLGLLGLLAIPIIVLIYILRSRYKSKNVSSTFIWKRSLKYVKRRIPLNFIMSLLLILQILTVVVASFAIARPTIKPFETEEKIVILDASASMLAESEGKTRFEHAKQLIEEAAEDIGPNHQITLIVAGEKATVLASRETDKGKFLTALKGAECSLNLADLNGALDHAGEVLKENAGATIQLYTDKSYIDTDGIELVDCKRKGEWNAAVISFEDNELVTGTEFVANIGNYGLNSSCTVKLYIDGKVVGQRIVELEANEIRQIRFTHSSTESTGTAEDRVKLSNAVKEYKTAEIRINTEDNFGYDDSFTIYPRTKEAVSILYISKHVVEEGGRKSCPSSLLYRALKASGYNIDSDFMYKDIDDVPELKGFDLYIFEGVALENYEMPTDGAVWVLDAKVAPKETGIIIDNHVYNSSTAGNKDGYNFEKTLSVDVISQITKNVDFSAPMKINLPTGPLFIPAAITEYRNIANMGTFKPIYTAKNGENYHDILVGGTVGSVRVILSTFDFGNSSLGAFVTDFPILIKNMVDYSMPDPLPERTAPIGSVINFNFPAGAKSVTLNYNDQLMSRINVEELSYDIVIDKPGKYEVVVTFPDDDDADDKDEEMRYTLTGHISDEESMIVQRVPTETLSSPDVQGAVIVTEPIEIFPYLIALLIILLIIEWGVYYREQY